VLIDARSVLSDSEFACDICIIGAGPAGIAIVDRLRESELSIILVEGGGFYPEAASQRLFSGESWGSKYYKLDACRYRVFGGSTRRWGGWCRPLDAADFEAREWLPWSSWPIGEDSISPYYCETSRLLELPTSNFDLANWRDCLPRPFELDDSNFENAFFQYSPRTRFGEVYRARILSSPNVRTILHANLTEISLSADSARADLLRILTLSGRSFIIRPRIVVLAAGGIENARMLLASCRDRPAGLGNEFDMVGRFFMEHPHVAAGHMISAPATTDRSFYTQANYGGREIRGVITPTPAARRKFRLLSASIAIESESYSVGVATLRIPMPLRFGAIGLYERVLSGRLKSASAALTFGSSQLASMGSRYRTWRKSRVARSRAGVESAHQVIHSLYFRTEQAPDPANRVILSKKLDALGVPRAELLWRVNASEISTITGWLGILDQDLRARGIGEIIYPIDGWEHDIVGGPHHMGTTRMSADPRHGVVDKHCRVHSLDNLYIAGCSVFPTGGYANPTFTLIALALRLADTLRDRLRHTTSIAPNATVV
jgi:choline dehydrogenase-like flavoprotein